MTAKAELVGSIHLSHHTPGSDEKGQLIQKPEVALPGQQGVAKTFL